MTKLLLLLLVVLTVGCAPSEDHFWVTGDATDREVEIMQSAADAWCETTSGAWCTTIDREPGANIIAIVPVGVLLGKDNALHTAHGGTQPWHEIQITDHRERATWENDLYWLTVHELGHTFGIIEHIEDTIMSKKYDRTELPTKELE